MQIHYTKELSALISNLNKMATMVDDQVEAALNCMIENNIEQCHIIKAKDLEIDAFDNLIQEECENILALFQPVAKDLRQIIAIIMINNQLERCGDIAVNIAQRVKKTHGSHNLIEESGILKMTKKAREMVKEAIDSFVNMDSELAKIVLAKDDYVDKLNKTAFKFLVSKMKDDNQLIDDCSQLIVLSRHVERLADHATNIAENTVFMLESQIIAHKKKLDNYSSQI